MKEKLLVIIPAKKESHRLPQKNLLEINGKPIFLLSVDYAIGEGIPIENIIVSTDGEEIMEICKKLKIPFFKETVDDSCMSNCIKQVLQSKNDEKLTHFALLQPTSPMRKPGMLKEMFDKISENKESKSIYSCRDIKFIGHLNGEFHLQRRAEDATTEFFHFFDGNILITNIELFNKDGVLFDSSSTYLKDSFPYYTQIDTMEEYWALKRFLEDSVHVDTYKTLKGRKKLVVVSNKCNHERDYSRFIDSCDKVIRCNRMDSLDTGLVGTKTTDVLVASYWYYESFNESARKIDVLRRDDVQVWFIPEPNATGPEYAEREKIKNWKYLSFQNYIQVGDFTTFGMAIGLAITSYPEYDIYVIGDLEPMIRAPGSTKHPYSKEQEFIKTAIQTRQVRPVLELEEQFNINFSDPIDPKKRPVLINERLISGREQEYEGKLKIFQKQGLEFVRKLEDRVFSELRYCFGTVKIEKLEDTVKATIKWDNIEKPEEYIFNKEKGGFFSTESTENTIIQQV